MGRVLPGLALLIFLVACSERLPEGVLSASKMPDLLFDVHLLDSRLSNMPIDSARAYLEPAYAGVFQRHGLDSSKFRQTMEYYMERPSELNGFYAQVQKRLQDKIEIEQTRINQMMQERNRRDSIVAVRHRDSLHRISRFEQDLDRKKHLLFRHEADSTIDQAVPFSFEAYSRELYEKQGLWRLELRRPEDFER